MGEQFFQGLKMPINVCKLEISYHRMLQSYGRRAPVPRSALLRSMIPGLNPDTIAPTDGEVIRGLIGEK